MKLSRLLVVSLEFPYPPNSGGTRDIYSRLKAMHDAGYEIDLVATVRNEPSDDDIKAIRQLVESIQIVHRSRNLRDLVRLEPFLVVSRSGLKKIKLIQDYAAVILESEHVGRVLENPTLRAKHRIIRIHNDEARMYRCLSESTSTMKEKILFKLESLKLRMYSSKVIRKCDSLWYISSVEMDRSASSFLENSTARKAFLVRSLVDADSFRKRSLVGATVFYAGALSIPINYHGLIWYLKNVHPQLLRIPDYKLVLVGRRGTGNLDALFEAVNTSERVVCRLDVQSLNEYFAGAAAFINPVQSGTGVKIKIYDATAEGLPVVTTPAGNEGTGFVDGIHAVVANSPELFAEGLLRVIVDKRFALNLVQNAQNELKSQNQSDRLLNILSSLT
jgi:hypothetical protein